jgi:hypothetical protein
MPRQWNGNTANYLDLGATFPYTNNYLTASAWVWFTSVSGLQVIFSNRNLGNFDGTWILYLESGVMKFQTKPEGSSLTSTATGTTSILPNRWYHVVGKQDGAGVHIYVNGVSEGFTATTRALASGFSVLMGRFINASSPLSAIMAHAALWNWPVPAQEIRRLAEGALPSDLTTRPGFWVSLDSGGNETDRSYRHQQCTQNGSVPPVRDPQAIDLAYGAYPWMPSAPPANYPAGSIPVARIEATTQLYGPYLVPGYPVSPGFIAATTALFTPTVSKSTVAPFIAATTVLHTPTVRRSSIALQERLGDTRVFTPRLVRLLVNVVPPTISGSAVEGQMLTASPGVWSGTEPITYAYQWRRCDAGGGACSDIAGAISATYTVQAADVAGTLRVRVTATQS